MTKDIGIYKNEIVNKIADLWTPLQEEEKKLISEHIEISKIKKNDFIYQFNEEPRKITCLIKGKIKVFKEGVNGRNQIIRVVKPTDFLGYRAFFANEDYKTAAIALETSIIATIPMKIIVKLIHSNYNIALYFIKHLSIVLGISDQRIINLSQKHVRGRLADALIFLQENYGYESDGQTLSVYLSRKELASLSNMTTSNAIRTLSSFVAENLIETERRKIKILDLRMLAKISELG